MTLIHRCTPSHRASLLFFVQLVHRGRVKMFQFCEGCFRQPKSVGVLLLATCQHIFCRRCATSLSQCAVCQQPCRTVEIRSDTLPTDLRDYFIPADKLLAKTLKVIKFQQDKQDAYIAGRIGVLEKYEAKKKSMCKLKEHYDELNASIKKEETLIRKLREQRKSPGVLAASPASPVVMSSPRDSRQVKFTPGTPIDQQRQRVVSRPGSSGESRWKTLLTQSPNDSQHSSSGGGGGGGRAFGVPPRRPSVSPIETIRKPADLVSAAKAGIYEQTARNIDRAMRRPTETVVKANRRGNDIERARNLLF